MKEPLLTFVASRRASGEIFAKFWRGGCFIGDKLFNDAFEWEKYKKENNLE